MAERELKVKFTGDTSGLNKAVGDAEKKTGGAASKIGAAGKAIAASFAVAGAAGVAFATKSVNTYKAVGGEVAKLKRFTGDSAEGASRMRAAFKLTGIDTDKATTALGRFSKNLVTGKLDDFNTSLAGQSGSAEKVKKAMEKLAEAQRDNHAAVVRFGRDMDKTDADRNRVAKSWTKLHEAEEKLAEVTQDAGNAMGKLGFQTRDAQGHILPMSKLLPQVAEVFEKMPSGAEETALAMELFGKAGTDMLPFLNKGAEGIAELAKQSDALGTTLSGKDLDAIKESKEQSRLWGLAMEGLQIQVGRYLLPVLNDLMGFVNGKLIPGLADIGAKIADWVQPKLAALGDWWAKDGKPKWDGFVSWIGLVLVPKLQEIGAKIVDWVKPKLDALAGWWEKDGKPGLGGFIKWIDEDLIPKMEGFGGGLFESFVNLVKDIGDWAQRNPEWAKPIALGIGAITLALQAFGVEMATTPWGLFFLLLTTLATSFYSAYTENDEFRRRVDETIDALEPKLQRIKQSFEDDFLAPMRRIAESFWTDFALPVWRAVQWVATVIGIAWEGVKMAGFVAAKHLVDVWMFFQRSYRVVADVVNVITGIIKAVWAGLTLAAFAVARSLVDVWIFFQRSYRVVADGISATTNAIKAVWNGLAAAAGAVRGLLGDIWRGMWGDFSGLGDRFGDVVRAIKGVWQGIPDFFRGIRDTVEAIIEGLLRYLGRAWERILSALPSNPLPSWVPVIGGNMAPVPPTAAPPIPALASGGIIPGSQWGTLVRAGENNRAEAIVPLSKMPAGGNTYNITVDVAPGADPVRAGAAVVDAIRSFERVNGQAWRTVPA